MDQCKDDDRGISRAKSLNTGGVNGAEISSKYKTATPSLLTRIKSIKKRVKDDGSSDSGSRALDDLICLDSFEEVYDSSPRIEVTQEGIRQALQDELRSISSHVDVFADLEADQINGNGGTIFRSYSHYERNIAFLAAALLNRHDAINYFLALNVEVTFHESKYGFGALHCAAFGGSVDCCKQLIGRGLSVNPNHGVYAPLHCAALSGNHKIIKLLVDAGASLDKSHPAGETALVSAVRAHCVKCVMTLLELGADANVADSHGMTPLHLATDFGDSDMVRALLENGKCVVDCPTRLEQNTPLHLAAQGGFSDTVRQLLERGAERNARNAKLKTPLHFASKVCLECTELLLKKGADPNAADVEQRTPLHTAVARSEVRFGPEITKLLLSWGAIVSKQDRYGYTPLHIAALNELPDCAEALVRRGADITTRTRGGTAALGLLARKTPSALDAVREVLDSYISCNDPEVSYREIQLSFNFKYLLQGCERGEMNFLQTVVDEGQRQLLEHPLCEAFLHMKWNKIRKYYIGRLSFALFLMFLLSVYVIIVLAYQCFEKPDPLKAVSFRVLEVKFDKSLCENKTRIGVWLRNNPNVLEAEEVLLLVVTMLEVVRKLYGLNGYKSFRDYFNLSNIIEWFVVVAVVATSYKFMNPPASLWQNHVGAFAVLAGWANLMVMIGHLPAFGTYVSMYTKVQKEFAKLLAAYICLLIGFTVCFCAIFVNSETFENPLVGFVKILVMMTGELEFGDLLEDIAKEDNIMSGKGAWLNVLMKMSALITFLLFLLFVTIILINLLIGIAVSDIQGLKKTAGLSKLVGLTKLISHIEAALFGKRVPACIVRLLNSTSGISSLVTVHPLNAREQRLPRDIMRAALDLSRQNRGKVSAKRQTFASRRPETIGDRPNEVVDMLLSLTEEVRQLKQLLIERKSD